MRRRSASPFGARDLLPLRPTTSSPASPISPRANASSSRISASTCSTSPATCSATSVRSRAACGRVNPRIKGEDVATMLLDHENGVTSRRRLQLRDEAGDGTLPPEPDRDRRQRGHDPPDTRATGSAVTTGRARATSTSTPEVPAWGGQPWHIIQDSVRPSSSTGSTACARAASPTHRPRQREDARPGRKQPISATRPACPCTPTSVRPSLRSAGQGGAERRTGLCAGSACPPSVRVERRASGRGGPPWPRRRLRLLRRDMVDDALVLGERELLLAGPDQHLGMVCLQPAEHASLTASKIGLPDMDASFVWKRMSALMKASALPRLRAGFQHVAQDRDVGRRGLRRGFPRHSRLEEVRAALRCSSESGEDDSMICAAVSTCFINDRAVSSQHLARVRHARSRSGRGRRATAWPRGSAGRPTPKRSISSRSEGMCVARL